MTLSVILLHDEMRDKTGKLVTTALTPIDLHDISRSCTTYGVEKFYISHSSRLMRELAETLRSFWELGYGAEYNPNRKEALSKTCIVSSLDEALADAELSSGQVPKLVATSAHSGGNRTSFKDFRSTVHDGHYLLMLGTGWGMSEQLLDRAGIFLEPINGPTQYNHLSVRGALAIMLDKILGF